jgi:hypothetical protein
VRVGIRGTSVALLFWVGSAQAEPTAAPPEHSAAMPANEVTVVGRRRAAAQGFTRAEVRQLPGALADPLRAIEALPGVTPTLSGVPYFFVRGAPPGDVGYFFDGIRLEVVNATLNREVLSASCSAKGCKERRVGPVTIPNLGIEAGF